jgi:hypothetical protein
VPVVPITWCLPCSSSKFMERVCSRIVKKSCGFSYRLAPMHYCLLFSKRWDWTWVLLETCWLSDLGLWQLSTHSYLYGFIRSMFLSPTAVCFCAS